MKPRNQDRLDHQAANLWEQYSQSNDERAQKAFWNVYESLLAKAKKPAKTKLQPAIHRPVAKKSIQEIDYTDLVIAHLEGIRLQKASKDVETNGCVSFLVVIMFIAVFFSLIVAIALTSIIGILICAILLALALGISLNGNKQIEYVFAFQATHIRCVKKTVGNRTIQNKIEVEVPYATIHNVQQNRDDSVSLINTTGQPWVATKSKLAFDKVHVPANISHSDDVYEFLEAVAKRNQQLSVARKP